MKVSKVIYMCTCWYGTSLQMEHKEPILIQTLSYMPVWRIQLKQGMFQKHMCPPWCKIQVYLLCRSKTCPKQVSKGLQYTKWTTHWAQKSGLTLTFWTCDLKINRDHFIEGNPCTKFDIDQVKGSNDIERTTLGLHTNRPTVAKQYAPFFKGGIKMPT